MLTIIFGSNQFIDTNGIVTFVDATNNVRKELFRIDLRNDFQPMITVEIRDAQHHLLGKVYRSTSFVAVNPDYEGITERSGADVKRMVLRKKDNNAEVFEMVNRGSHEVKVNNRDVINTVVEINGTFYIKGCPFKIEATKQYLDINTNKLIRCTKYGGGFGIELTPTGFAL